MFLFSIIIQDGRTPRHGALSNYKQYVETKGVSQNHKTERRDRGGDDINIQTTEETDK